MAFKNLEDRIPENEVERYLHIFEKLRDPTRTTLGYLLDIASLAENRQLDEDYFVFGGYAVLTHLVSVYTEGVVLSWRGSEDIDMAGSEPLLQALKGEYHVLSDRPSPNVKAKRTIKLKNETEGEVRIDYVDANSRTEKSKPDEQPAYGELETYNIFGIPVRVASAIDLIRNKIRFADKEKAHAQDIVSLLGVMEHRKALPVDVCRALDNEQKAGLYNVLIGYERNLEAARMTVGPSKEFTSDLKNELKRYKE